MAVSCAPDVPRTCRGIPEAVTGAPERRGADHLDSEDDVLLEFRCDGCPYDGGEYPLGPRANDPVLPTPPCEEDILAYTHFLISPEGAVLHRCRVDAPTWYDPSGNEVYADPDSPLLHFGHGGPLVRMHGASLITGP
ncbi:hypothetical protein [Sorangium sp. So ce341]|uniref:hypothetical protein n=1 Tax=Sorangium sp. So ce341 TaxID=3133302 RepID=UPI003F60621B